MFCSTDLNHNTGWKAPQQSRAIQIVRRNSSRKFISLGFNSLDLNQFISINSSMLFKYLCTTWGQWTHQWLYLNNGTFLPAAGNTDIWLYSAFQIWTTLIHRVIMLVSYGCSFCSKVIASWTSISMSWYHWSAWATKDWSHYLCAHLLSNWSCKVFWKMHLVICNHKWQWPSTLTDPKYALIFV